MSEERRGRGPVESGPVERGLGERGSDVHTEPINRLVDDLFRVLLKHGEGWRSSTPQVDNPGGVAFAALLALKSVLAADSDHKEPLVASLATNVDELLDWIGTTCSVPIPTTEPEALKNEPTPEQRLAGRAYWTNRIRARLQQVVIEEMKAMSNGPLGFSPTPVFIGHLIALLAFVDTAPEDRPEEITELRVAMVKCIRLSGALVEGVTIPAATSAKN